MPPLVLNLPQLGGDLGLGNRHGFVGSCHHVDQVVFLGVQRLEFGLELLAAETTGRFGVGHALGHVSSNVGDKLGREVDGGVKVFHGILDAQHVDMPSGTGPHLGVAAKEVQVLGAPPVD
ncbi:MAG TPA: hypothetical protein VG756_29525 [Pseudonocardiaceae bacterium]|nr:hypothetical protein [Pseudonocardiaceae bacterium]